MAMKNNSFDSRSLFFEDPFYFDGMTGEDREYIFYLCRKNGESRQALIDLTHRKRQLPSVDKRTKKDVFDFFGADMNYVFGEHMLH